MVARINPSKSIRRILQYNEQKCAVGKAELLRAENFLKVETELQWQDKLGVFQRLQALNEATGTNALHIFLSFDPSEKIADDIQIEIAQRYMRGIGFEDQPYLVYRHDDAGHPHLHIVTTNIRFDGRRIELHNLGRNASAQTRKQVEEEFGLVKAEGRGRQAQSIEQSIEKQKAQYGKRPTKSEISRVLRLVIDQYKYSSLEELNAVLGLYNVVADRGSPGSKMYEQEGLVFQMLDEQGKKVSASIKASALYMQPTLKKLRVKMKRNAELKKPQTKRVRSAIDFALIKKKAPDLNYLVGSLAKQQIQVLFRQTGEGFIYGMTFIDHHSKVVFNGSDLGKNYSAKNILERCQLPAWK
ncbi:MAG: relaxase/mobilization nuclease domain-containing protein, partial [Chitinophagaceae bacterium]|nr:relaxase/mobilization nuclease domain-containing protein [Chitinophagaceae bacterium]